MRKDLKMKRTLYQLAVLFVLGIITQTAKAQLYETYPLSDSDSTFQAYVYQAPSKGKSGDGLECYLYTEYSIPRNEALESYK